MEPFDLKAFLESLTIEDFSIVSIEVERDSSGQSAHAELLVQMKGETYSDKAAPILVSYNSAHIGFRAEIGPPLAQTDTEETFTAVGGYVNAWNMEGRLTTAFMRYDDDGHPEDPFWGTTCGIPLVPFHFSSEEGIEVLRQTISILFSVFCAETMIITGEISEAVNFVREGGDEFDFDEPREPDKPPGKLN